MLRKSLSAMAVGCLLAISIASGCGEDNGGGGTDTDSDTFACTNGTLEGDYSVATQEDLDALAGYTAVNGELDISCSTCASLAQLACLESVGGRFDLRDAAALTTLAGLESLATVGEDFLIFDLAISSLEGLGSLTSVGASLWLDSNALVSLDGIENLDSIGNALMVTDNDALERIDGVSGLTSIGSVHVVGNDSLPYCDVCELFEQLGTLEGPMICEENLADDCGTTECECP